MDINLTQEQANKFMKDKYININIGDYKIYLELTSDNYLYYFELAKTKNGKIGQIYTYNICELELLKPKRTNDPSWHHNDPLCPNCGTYMIYKFEHCPKCGQKLDWSEK